MVMVTVTVTVTVMLLVTGTVGDGADPVCTGQPWQPWQPCPHGRVVKSRPEIPCRPKWIWKEVAEQSTAKKTGQQGWK